MKFHHLNSEAYYDQVFKFHHEQNPNLREDRINVLIKDHWRNNPKAKAHYKTKGRFVKMIRSVESRELSSIYRRLRENFLHIK